MVQVSLGLVQSWLVQQLFDEVLPAGELVGIARIAAASVVVQLAWLGVQRLAHIQEAGLAMRVSGRLRRAVFRALHARDEPAPPPVSQLLGDLQQLDDLLTRALPQTLTNVVVVVLSFGFLAWLDWRLALAVLVGMGLAVAPPMLLTRRATPRVEAHRAAQQATGARLEEAHALRGVTRLLGLLPWQVARFEPDAAAQDGTMRREHLATAGVVSVAITSGSFVPLALMLLGAALVLTGELGVGAILAAVSVVSFIQVSLSALARGVPRLLRARPAWRRIRALVRRAPDPGDTEALPALESAVRLASVRFGYGDDPDLFDDLTLEIPRGRMVALVGTSGSGKSTVLRLLSGEEMPRDGRVTWDDADWSAASAACRAAHLGVVSQATRLFDLSVRENIRLGRLDADDAAVEAAAAQAGLPLDLLDRPAGPLGEQLSGGQRQRVALARVVLRSPNLLLLDEPTAALDPANEAAFEAVLKQFRQGRTTVLVTHRLQQARLADEFVVMEGGRVIEQGSHRALRALGGTYARLWKQQSRVSMGPRTMVPSIDTSGLAAMPLFEGVPNPVLAQLATRFVPLQAAADTPLVTQGEPGDRFFVLVRGRAAVVRDGVRVVVLDEGAFFGERALVTAEPRNATVSAVGHVTALALGRADFDTLLADQPEVRARLEAAIQAMPAAARR